MAAHIRGLNLADGSRKIRGHRGRESGQRAADMVAGTGSGNSKPTSSDEHPSAGPHLPNSTTNRGSSIQMPAIWGTPHSMAYTLSLFYKEKNCQKDEAMNPKPQSKKDGAELGPMFPVLPSSQLYHQKLCSIVAGYIVSWDCYTEVPGYHRTILHSSRGEGQGQRLAWSGSGEGALEG